MDYNDPDDEFPVGDGRADTTTHVTCPYCSKIVEISIDPGGGSVQEYVEDCEVCCNPWQVNVQFIDGAAFVEVSALDR